MKGRWRVAITGWRRRLHVRVCGLPLDARRAGAQAQPTAVRAFVKITRSGICGASKRLRRIGDAVARRPCRDPESGVTSADWSQAQQHGKGADAIYLPEGRTVEQIVRAAVTKALAEQGYAVVDRTSPHFDSALPAQLDIELFWAWFTLPLRSRRHRSSSAPC